MPRGYVIYNPKCALLSLVYLCTNDNHRHRRVLYISAWALALLASTNKAIPTASERGASDNARASRFFYALINPL